jgi:hypothetical protein
MKSTKLFQAAAVTISSAGLIFPSAQVMAAAPQEQAAKSQAESAAPAVLDAKLSNGGVLRGQVVDGQGQPVANAPVSVLYEGKEVVSTKTAADGSFAVSGLRGGTHTVVSGDNGGICRLWSTDTAPPSARESVMIVRGGQVVRGQLSPTGKVIVLGAIVGGIVAGGVISQGDSNGNGGSGS